MFKLFEFCILKIVNSWILSEVLYRNI